MPTHRRTPARRVRRTLAHALTGARPALRLLQVAAASCLLSLTLGSALVAAQQDTTLPETSEVAPISADVRRALDRHACSLDGLPRGQIPGSALIRTAAGELAHVSFDRGWRIHTSTAHAATMVAVCRAPDPSRAASGR